MNSIIQASAKDASTLVTIGRISVTEAHKESFAAKILNAFVENNYNDEVIKKELCDTKIFRTSLVTKASQPGFQK